MFVAHEHTSKHKCTQVQCDSNNHCRDLQMDQFLIFSLELEYVGVT